MACAGRLFPQNAAVSLPETRQPSEGCTDAAPAPQPGMAAGRGGRMQSGAMALAASLPPEGRPSAAPLHSETRGRWLPAFLERVFPDSFTFEISKEE